ncbi:hypothetical protein CRENBAI_016637 [Crenichthys baileyi]|uniref:Uncharacterized protein n=1 Tax=Crenichthys baileyi TaxID=28760 RepID=A0AAV9S4P3_9TELE
MGGLGGEGGYVVAVQANRCARGVVKGNEREWHKWNLIKGGACLSKLAVARTVEQSDSCLVRERTRTTSVIQVGSLLTQIELLLSSLPLRLQLHLTVEAVQRRK